MALLVLLGEPEPAAKASTKVGAQVPVAVAATPDGRGLWIASTDGAVTPDGDALSHGDASSYPLAAPVVSMAATPSGGGYWLMGADGGVFSFGDAGYHGSAAADGLVQPPVQIAAAPGGAGYWIVARDGGVFSFGDAAFHGSAAGYHSTAPIAGLAATPDGGGYWVVARDGGVFSFGDAGYHGSASRDHLEAPIVGMAATPDGGGYWLVGRDGGVFSFGDAAYQGSLGGSQLPAPVIAIVASPRGSGYWLVLGDGQIRPFGDAAPIQATAMQVEGYSLAGELIGLDPGHNGGNGSDPSYIDQPVWNGREYEPCDTAGTETDSGYTESAFNFDVATRLTALLRSFGATVVLTRNSNSGVGPCVTRRAAIVNGAKADASLDIHADGGPSGGRGLTVLEPVADGPNDGVINQSDQLAVIVRNSFEAATGEPPSDYDGSNGLQPRDDLAGLNLTTVAKVLIECANMRNATDASLTESPSWRQKAATGLAKGLSQYLIGFP